MNQNKYIFTLLLIFSSIANCQTINTTIEHVSSLENSEISFFYNEFQHLFPILNQSYVNNIDLKFDYFPTNCLQKYPAIGFTRKEYNPKIPQSNTGFYKIYFPQNFIDCTNKWLDYSVVPPKELIRLKQSSMYLNNKDILDTMFSKELSSNNISFRNFLKIRNQAYFTEVHRQIKKGG